jgi:hypothetical protein
MDLTKDDVVTKEDLTKTDVDVTKNDVTKEDVVTKKDVVTKEDLVKRERKAFSLGKKCSDIFREIKQLRKRQKMFYSAHLRVTNSLDQRMFNLEREAESLNNIDNIKVGEEGFVGKMEPRLEEVHHKLLDCKIDFLSDMEEENKRSCPHF